MVMIKKFDEKTELVPENEVPEGLFTSEENILLERFDGVNDVKLQEIVDAARSLFEGMGDIELRKLALRVYHIINDERQAARQTLLDPSYGPRAITRRNRAASVERLRNIGRASMPSEPPPAIS